MPDNGSLCAIRVLFKSDSQLNITIQPKRFVSNRKAASLAISHRGYHALILLSDFRACDKA